MADVTVEVSGLAEFVRELRRVDFGKDLGRANQAVSEPIAADARSRAMSRGGSAAKTARSIKATRKAAKATIAVGGPRFPFAWGAEFGAKKYRQFPRWRGNQWNPDAGGVGYFLHPAIRDGKEAFERRYLDEIEKVAAKAFPD